MRHKALQFNSVEAFMFNNAVLVQVQRVHGRRIAKTRVQERTMHCRAN